MVQIIICSLAIFVSAVIQCLPSFHDRIILRRFLAAAILLVPCIWPMEGAVVTTYTTIATKDVKLIFVYAAIPTLVIIALTQSASRFKENLDIYPEMRTSRWNLRLFFFNLLSWCCYLTAYEFLFRGYLFYSCLNSMPVANALIVTTTLYGLAHLHKREKEFLLSIPFGIMLCCITIETNNVWTAVILHIALALSNDFFAFRANSHFSFVAPHFKKINI